MRPALPSVVSWNCTLVIAFIIHLCCHGQTSESDSTCRVTGPAGVESLDPGSPVGGRNLMKESHWHCSLVRSHLRHAGRFSSPAISSIHLGQGNKDRQYQVFLTLLPLPPTVQTSRSRPAAFLTCSGRSLIRHSVTGPATSTTAGWQRKREGKY